MRCIVYPDDKITVRPRTANPSNGFRVDVYCNVEDINTVIILDEKKARKLIKQMEKLLG